MSEVTSWTETYHFSFDTTSPFRCESPNGHFFTSPTVRLFGIPWMLRYFPKWKDTDKGDIILRLLDMPNGVASVRVRRITKYNETGQLLEELDTFNEVHSNWGSKVTNMVPTTELTQLTGSMTIELLSVKDVHGDSVWDKFAAKCQERKRKTNKRNKSKEKKEDESDGVMAAFDDTFSLEVESEDAPFHESLTGIYHFTFDTTAPFRHESQNGAYFTSPTFRLFGFPWNLDFFPKWKDTNKGDTFLCLTALPKNVAEIKVRRVKMYKETGQVFEEIDLYTAQQHNRGSKQSNMIDADLEILSGSMKIELLEVRDSNGNSIYDQWVAKCKGKEIESEQNAENEQKTEALAAPVTPNIGNQHGNPHNPSTPTDPSPEIQIGGHLQAQFFEEAANQIGRITTQLNELQISIRRIEQLLDCIEEQQPSYSSDGLQKQIDDIRRRVSRLISGASVYSESEEDQFRKWIEETVGLPEYFDVFVENGVERLSVMQMFTVKELEMVGISKIGHRLLISKAIETLNQGD